MDKTDRHKTGINLKIAKLAGPAKGVAESRSLVLDYILAEIRATRRVHHLPEPKLGLEEIEREAGAKSAAERIIKMTLDRHASEIYSMPHPIFDKICDIRRGRQLNRPGSYSGRRIPPIHAAGVLRTVLEIALQTIVQLPQKGAPVKDGKADLKRLASHCEKLANEMDRVFKKGVVCHHAMVYFSGSHSPGLEQFYRQVEELKRNAETIRAILAKSRSTKQKTGSPNPQVRLALSLVGWFEVATGKKQYDRFKTLLDAAYSANGITIPRWVGRLEIEMARDRARMKAWNRSLAVQSTFPISPKSLQNPIRI